MLIESKPGPYHQFLLFGDSITQQSASQEQGFAFMPALQDSRFLPLRLPAAFSAIMLQVEKSVAFHSRLEDSLLTQHPSLAYIRRLDVLNRGFR